MKSNNYITNMQMKLCFEDCDIAAYKLTDSTLLNNYFIVTSEGTRRLLACPEVIGMEVCESMLPATSEMLRFLAAECNIGNCSILNILRGGLNFPIEQAFHDQDLQVKNIDFLSCERTFDESGVPNGLKIKYSQVVPANDSMLVLGDIIASGDTLRYCLDNVIQQYRAANCELKSIIIFTIGGTKAIGLAERLTKDIRQIWPNFHGITLVFYEGVFSCYEPGDTGVSGINIPLIDFIWRGGVISPDFMRHVLKAPYALLEKCIIYDGGARRFNIDEHAHEVIDFWRHLAQSADNINFDDLLEEKLGHSLDVSFDEWVAACHFEHIPTHEQKDLFQLEKDYIANVKNQNLAQIAEQRKQELTSYFSKKTNFSARKNLNQVT